MFYLKLDGNAVCGLFFYCRNHSVMSGREERFRIPKHRENDNMGNNKNSVIPAVLKRESRDHIKLPKQNLDTPVTPEYDGFPPVTEGLMP